MKIKNLTPRNLRSLTIVVANGEVNPDHKRRCGSRKERRKMSKKKLDRFAHTTAPIMRDSSLLFVRAAHGYPKGTHATVKQMKLTLSTGSRSFVCKMPDGKQLVIPSAAIKTRMK